LSTKTPHYWAIIPAAGSGSRMGSEKPKQYLLLQDKPILQHTLERLQAAKLTGLVVCLAENDRYWHTIQVPSNSVILAPGGTERCHSVWNGLQQLPAYAQPDDWVLVHDAARPCVRVTDIQKLIMTLTHHPIGGLLALPVRDTMKRVDTQNTVIATVNREGLWHALTPQMFRLKILATALQQVLAQGDIVTDESQAVEKLGYRPLLVEGQADNIKITHPQDLELATLYLEQQKIYAR
jgi:2-C-methyl-D-erythritol 4-phosphate cytidylyltransferase